MRVLLEGTYREVLRSTRSLSSFQIVTEESRRVDRNNFRILKNYYESCIETGLFDQVSLSYFFQEIYKLRADEIYKQEENDSIFQITAQQLDIIAYPKSEGLIMDVGGLFTLEMYPDDNDRTNMALTISAPAQEDEPMMLQAGRDTLFDLMFSLFGTDNSTKRDLSRSFELEEAGLAPLTESEIYSMVDNAMFVQTSLIELAKLRYLKKKKKSQKFKNYPILVTNIKKTLKQYGRRWRCFHLYDRRSQSSFPFT
jgi:hypothetical protein